MHFMAAAGAHVVDIVSETNPQTWGPLSDKAVVVGEYKRKINKVSAQEVYAAGTQLRNT